MGVYAEGDQVRLRGVRGRRYRVERIHLDGLVSVRGVEGLRTVASGDVVADAAARRGRVVTVSAAAGSHRAGRR